VLDRGFQYGDGLFETLRVVEGKPCHWTRHMARLTAGCDKLRISMPTPALLLSEAMSLCANEAHAVLKMIVTRGVGKRGYAPQEKPASTRVLSVTAAPHYSPAHYRDGVAVRVCGIGLGSNPALAGIKHLNRLEQVLARAEWDDPAIVEGLMLDSNNHVIEGTMSNLFCVQDNGGISTLKTPLLDQCGVAGITRDRVMQSADARGISLQETALTLDDLHQSQELFLCNTLIGIWPVRQLDNHVFPVGPMTRQLSEALEALDD